MLQARFLILMYLVDLVLPTPLPNTTGDSSQATYGVDISFPMHHPIDSQRYPHFANRYQRLLESCYRFATKYECDMHEGHRLQKNLMQPPTQHNYTELGFEKLTVPSVIWKPLIAFYEENLNNAQPEIWPFVSLYLNDWETFPEFISVEDATLRGSAEVKQLIQDEVRTIIEEWVGRKVEPTSIYGIRIYKNNSVLGTHIDRLPLVSSAIIQVAQDVDEPWPLEVYDHQGKAHNVTLQPGEMVLYESHTVLHGRPFPMRGKHYAAIFVHYKPIDHDHLNTLIELPLEEISETNQTSEESEETESGEQKRTHLRSRKVDDIRRKFSEVDEQVEDEIRHEDVYPAEKKPNYKHLISAIEEKSVPDVIGILTHDPSLLDYSYEDGWTPLHHAARAGNTMIMYTLLSKGADVMKKATNGNLPIEVANSFLPYGHPVIKLIRQRTRKREGTME